ncbi:hypothetical protein FGG08_002867 [Glutinoglossum americanum]|uniref:Uncharacterized protein n=1 Tax=Glutinoglossum americanum TaxID=1670608 RepID=A0A9P8I8B7_9PEZI|nr:hypothetical protein FGG08_002867 [Glutinoglossum americanum]
MVSGLEKKTVKMETERMILENSLAILRARQRSLSRFRKEELKRWVGQDFAEKSDGTSPEEDRVEVERSFARSGALHDLEVETSRAEEHGTERSVDNGDGRNVERNGSAHRRLRQNVLEKDGN